VSKPVGASYANPFRCSWASGQEAANAPHYRKLVFNIAKREPREGETHTPKRSKQLGYMERASLFEKREKLTRDAKAILDAAPAEGMTKADGIRFDGMMGEVETIDAQIRTIESEDRAKTNAIKPQGSADAPYGVVRGTNPDHNGKDEPLMFRTADGKEVRGLRPKERMSDLSPYRDALDPGKFFRGILTGDWRQADAEMRAASEGTLSGGGYLLPAPLASYIIDRARNAAVILAAGAITIPMENSTLAIARVTGDVATAWLAENAAQTSADTAFDRVTLSAKTLSAMTKASVELAEDTDFANIVAMQLAKVIAIEIDRAATEGTGASNQPSGILVQSGVALDTTTFGTNGSAISGTTPAGAVAWDWLSKAIYAVRQLNEVPNAVIYHERTAAELDLLRASTGVFLPPPPSVQNLENGVRTTNALSITRTQGTGTTCSNAYVGDFSKLLMGIRNALVLEVSREASDATSQAFANRQVFIRAYGRYDIALGRPAAFRVVEGIL